MFVSAVECREIEVGLYCPQCHRPIVQGELGPYCARCGWYPNWREDQLGKAFADAQS